MAVMGAVGAKNQTCSGLSVVAPNIETESCVYNFAGSLEQWPHNRDSAKIQKLYNHKPALRLYHLNSGNTEREKNTHNKKNLKVKKFGGIPQCKFSCDS